MNTPSPVIKFKSTETFEIALILLYNARKNLNLTKKQAQILIVAKNHRKSKTFLELKNLTRLNQSGKYSPLNILKTIHKNQSILNKIEESKQSINLKHQASDLANKKPNGKKLLNDLKIPELTFKGSLSCLYSVIKQLSITTKQKKIIVAAKKGKGRGGKIIFKKLKDLTKLNKSGTCSPFYLLEVVKKNHLELFQFIDGKTTSNDIGESSSNNTKDKKSLPLDTNYKYPTKTSKSIWTVKNK